VIFLILTVRYFIYIFQPARDDRQRIVLFGDSITQHGFNPELNGWAASLAHYYSRRADVINRGFSGYNTRWGLLISDDVVLQVNPAMVVIFFGANDAVIEQGLTYVPLEEYKSNLLSMIKKFKSKCPKLAIVLITPPPVDELKLKVYRNQHFSLSNYYTSSYN
jgi:lysophospholipase L1-like esterase